MQAGGKPWTSAAGWQQRASGGGAAAGRRRGGGESCPAAAASRCRGETGRAVEPTDVQRPQRRQGETPQSSRLFPIIPHCSVISAETATTSTILGLVQYRHSLTHRIAGSIGHIDVRQTSKRECGYAAVITPLHACITDTGTLFGRCC